MCGQADGNGETIWGGVILVGMKEKMRLWVGRNFKTRADNIEDSNEEIEI